MKITLILLLLVILSIEDTLACQFNTDCYTGSKCYKESGKLSGICRGGLFPGNKYDLNPYKDPSELDDIYGSTCSFDSDCGVNYKCFKEKSSINGVCIKRQ